jgi:hypothetical protein
VTHETIRLDRYIVTTLLRDLVGHDRHPSAYLVYLHLTIRATGGRHATVTASYEDLATATGLSKSGVQQAVRTLKRRRLIRVERATPTSIPEYEVMTPWRR